MRNCLNLGRLVVAACLVAATAGVASAQVGRVGGVVKNDEGQPINGATVIAENPAASPSSFTTTTDDKGRFSFIGLRAGMWKFIAEAPGYEREAGSLAVKTVGAPNPPLQFTLEKAAGGGAFIGLTSAAAKDIQADLALADADYNAGKYDDAITKYRGIMVKAPTLSAINLQIAAAYRNKKEYDAALQAYNDLLKVDPKSEPALVGIGMTNLEKGDLEAADKTLTEAAALASASREVFYSLGEVKFAKGDVPEAEKWYQKSAQTDPAWGKPLFKLGLVELNKGDKATTIAAMEKVIVADPTSPEAAMAKQVIEDLKK